MVWFMPEGVTSVDGFSKNRAFVVDDDATVDGRNPAPAEMVNIALFSEFYTSRVMQDFFHQQ